MIVRLVEVSIPSVSARLRPRPFSPKTDAWNDPLFSLHRYGRSDRMVVLSVRRSRSQVGRSPLTLKLRNKDDEGRKSGKRIGIRDLGLKKPLLGLVGWLLQLGSLCVYFGMTGLFGSLTDGALSPAHGRKKAGCWGNIISAIAVCLI